jgi:hypothetical protein
VSGPVGAVLALVLVDEAGDAGDVDDVGEFVVAMTTITAASAASPRPTRPRTPHEGRPRSAPWSAVASCRISEGGVGTVPIAPPGPSVAASAATGRWLIIGAPHWAQTSAAAGVSAPHSRHRVCCIPADRHHPLAEHAAVALADLTALTPVYGNVNAAFPLLTVRLNTGKAVRAR